MLSAFQNYYTAILRVVTSSSKIPCVNFLPVTFIVASIAS